MSKLEGLSNHKREVRIQRMWKSHYTMVKRYRELPLRRVVRASQNLIWAKSISKMLAKQ